MMLVCGLAVLCNAQAKGAQTAMGTVKSLDPKAMVVVVTVTQKDKSTTDMIFSVTKATTVMEGDAAKTLADLQEGQRVQVTYGPAGTGKYPVISAITINPPKKSSKKGG
jgi:uncharacterized lipoprotein YajG